MSNVVDFQNKLTVNARFMMDFMQAEPPCFALGLVEERMRASGFLALALVHPYHMSTPPPGFVSATRCWALRRSR